MANYTINVHGFPNSEVPDDRGPLLATCELDNVPVDLINNPEGDWIYIPMYGANGTGIWIGNNPLQHS